MKESSCSGDGFLMAMMFPPLVLNGEQWIKVWGLPPQLWSRECLNHITECCVGLVEIDAETFKSPSPLAPRIRLRSGELEKILRVLANHLMGVDCILAIEVELPFLASSSDR